MVCCLILIKENIFAVEMNICFFASLCFNLLKVINENNFFSASQKTPAITLLSNAVHFTFFGTKLSVFTHIIERCLIFGVSKVVEPRKRMKSVKVFLIRSKLLKNSFSRFWSTFYKCDPILCFLINNSCYKKYSFFGDTYCRSYITHHWKPIIDNHIGYLLPGDIQHEWPFWPTSGWSSLGNVRCLNSTLTFLSIQHEGALHEPLTTLREFPMAKNYSKYRI